MAKRLTDKELKTKIADLELKIKELQNELQSAPFGSRRRRSSLPLEICELTAERLEFTKEYLSRH